ncbi:ABC transporter ATP-binding protein [Candidatus Synechococcus calcipolaris G9]|uniref:ABC transporter ATP-binding protein n=1 Tax=Candidatus Synechococcus calcipolaris G9 TaxID=1497997 RepID=A0ABT6EYV8_9SYNE|nr:ABC transporter ATP-binding protein [Candidatus Synechococcus calcipolaris]MDG2990423.1 ABC transporter ATP-binding protein [Candidatus Synechococcus calcipolaris G9]
MTEPVANQPLLRVHEVYGGYLPDLDILRGINFVLYPGELVSIIGPNGAGKSTLAKTIAGLLTPRQGSITLRDEDITHLRPNQVVQKGIAYVPQITNVFRSLTVDENLEMGAFIGDRNITILKQKIFAAFPRLAERRKQRAGTLSGGERQMLAMGRAMMMDPQVLVLDEPSAALSPLLVSNVFAKIKEINREGTSIILVEQNARKALAMSDRGYVLDMGKDCFEGSGPDLLDNPKVGELYLGAGHH